MSKILYIAGYGRSGSTVLDILLGNHSKITGVGEVTFLLDELSAPDRGCSCGMPYRECEFWKDFVRQQSAGGDLAQLVRGVEQQRSLFRLLSRLIGDRERETYRRYQTDLFDYVVSRSGKPIVVDSSKSARGTVGRFFALRKLASQDVYVLHLVRDGLATMESLVVTGRNWAIEGYVQSPKWTGVRAALGWVSTNIWVSLLGRLLGRDRYMLLRYEDFVADPATALRRIGRFCGFDAEELIDRIAQGGDFEVTHSVGGNRVRLQRRITLKRETGLRAGGRLTRSNRLLFVLVGGWLRRHYGYGKRRVWNAKS